MTHHLSTTSRRAGRRLRLGLLGGALLIGAFVLPVGAQSPAASDAPAPAATPTLTFAPLVTLPPVAEPANPTPEELADGYSLGAADAPVQIEVWEDFQCPFCARWTAAVKPALVEQYIRPGVARLTYRPLAFLGEESRWAAVAADLAMEQNRFWALHDRLYANHLGENVGSYSLERILAMAEAAGLDMEPFMDGLTLDKARERFAALEARSRADASLLGINATPSVVVNGRLLESPDYDTIAAAVEAALAEAASPAP
jgi:protein-disulfide isomerase